MSRPNDVRDTLFIGGRWIPSSWAQTIAVIDSTTEEVIGTIPEGTTEDVEAAVRAALQAFPEWSATPVANRAPPSCPTSARR